MYHDSFISMRLCVFIYICTYTYKEICACVVVIATQLYSACGKIVYKDTALVCITSRYPYLYISHLNNIFFLYIPMYYMDVLCSIYFKFMHRACKSFGILYGNFFFEKRKKNEMRKKFL